MKRNIERFPSKQMYPYLSLVERNVAEFCHNIDRGSWLVWVKITYFLRFFWIILGVLNTFPVKWCSFSTKHASASQHLLCKLMACWEYFLLCVQHVSWYFHHADGKERRLWGISRFKSERTGRRGTWALEHCRQPPTFKQRSNTVVDNIWALHSKHQRSAHVCHDSSKLKWKYLLDINHVYRA